MKNVLLVVNDNPIDPLGIMYLIGNVKANFDVLFVNNINDERIYKTDIKKYDVVGFSTITGSHKFHQTLAAYFKNIKKELITIMGGSHPTFFPKEALALYDIDYICIGEGIVAFDKFLNGESSKNIINRYEDYTGVLEPAVDINKIIIDRKTVYNVDGRDKNPIRNFMGTWGCPFNCSYCFNKSYDKLYDHQKTARVKYKNPFLFVKEIEDCVREYNTKFLYIQDDTFIINKKWFNDVTGLIKTQIDLPYHCHVRCDLMNEKIVKRLKETGCKSVTFAIENASYEYREEILNRKMTEEQILYTAALLHKYEILFRIENMVGLPINDLNDNIETMKINSKCKPTIGWASLFQPFPNTKLGNICKEYNYWNGDIDTINSSFFDESPLNINNKKEIERLQKIFSLAVDNKIIYWLTPLLIRLPFDNLYKKLYLKFKNKKYDELYSWED